jgi:branched-chain amino acid transport system substrate-binding protein
VEAAKGMSWTSPRGPMSIDPATRDTIQTVYIREVKKVGDSLQNVIIAEIPDVKDPLHPAGN